MNQRGRILVPASLLPVVLCIALAVAAQGGPASYPQKPVHLIVATVAGAPPDIVARILATHLEGEFGQPVIVENRPGAIGSIGLAALSHSAPDGYTLGMLAMPYIVAPSLITVPFDFERDFAPVARVTRSYSMLAVRADAHIDSVTELIARARARPGSIAYASQGNATPSHLAGTLLQRETNTRLLHVPYKANALAGVLAGDVDVMIGPAYPMWPYVKSGKLRALATTAPKRLEAYPDVPTLAELGYPGVQITDWQGVLVPRGTPREIVMKLSAVLKVVMDTPEVKQKLESMGIEASFADADEFGSLMSNELHRWDAVVRETGMKVD